MRRHGSKTISELRVISLLKLVTTHSSPLPNPKPQLNWLIALIGLTTLLVHASENRDAGPDLFSDVAEAVGIDFVHFNGMSGEYYFCEMMGPGGALFD